MTCGPILTAFRWTTRRDASRPYISPAVTDTGENWWAVVVPAEPNDIVSFHWFLWTARRRLRKIKRSRSL